MVGTVLTGGLGGILIAGVSYASSINDKINSNDLANERDSLIKKINEV